MLVVRDALQLTCLLILLLEEMLHTSLLDESDSSAEGDELLHLTHIDAVVVGVADLWAARDDDDLLRTQAVEDPDDTLAKGRPTHDAVVDDDEVVHATLYGAVGDVIDVCCELIAALPLGDEGAELDVLDSDLLGADACGEDLTQRFVGERRRALDLSELLLGEVLVHTLDHTIVCDFGRVGDEGEDGVA